MPVLTLDYRHCGRKRPLYIKNSEVEGIAALAREQLVDTNTDAIPFSVLSDISGLKINGIAFDLFVSTNEIVHDEEGNPVLGICEYDPGIPDAAMVSVSPAGEHASEELVRSTLGHELGHAIFDAPGWIVNARGPGLFDDASETARRAYRTTTRDAEHLAKGPPVNFGSAMSPTSISHPTQDPHYFAELRANEFMGSLLVPRQRLQLALKELAPEFNVTIHHNPSLDSENLDTGFYLAASDDEGRFEMECLERGVAAHFGVNRRFIEVRMERYGLKR